jgi:mannose/fructose/N-acetylgalactosamine-specific phosphotransferase system component IIC
MGMILSKVISGVSSLAFIAIAVVGAIGAYYSYKSKTELAKTSPTIKDAESDSHKGFLYSLIASLTAIAMAVLSALILIV